MMVEIEERDEERYETLDRTEGDRIALEFFVTYFHEDGGEGGLLRAKDVERKVPDGHWQVLEQERETRQTRRNDLGTYT